MATAAAATSQRLVFAALGGSAETAPPAANAASSIGAWLDGIPAKGTSVSVDGVSLDGSTATVTNRLEVVAPDPLTQGRRLQAKIEMVLERDGSGLWRATSARLEEQGLGLLADPTVLRRGTIVVLSDGATSANGRAVINTAVAELPRLRKRYDSLDDTDGGVLIVLSDDVTRAARAIGEEPGRSVPQVMGLTTSRGDLLIDAGVAMPERDRRALVVHELTHRAMISTITTMPLFLVEGVATAEEMAVIGRDARITASLVVRDAARNGDLRLAERFDDDEAWMAARSDDDLAVNYMSAGVTVTYLESAFGHDAVLELLESQQRRRFEEALRDTTGLTPAELEKRVLAWAASQSTGYVLVG